MKQAWAVYRPLDLTGKIDTNPLHPTSWKCLAIIVGDPEKKQSFVDSVPGYDMMRAQRASYFYDHGEPAEPPWSLYAGEDWEPVTIPSEDSIKSCKTAAQNLGKFLFGTEPHAFFDGSGNPNPPLPDTSLSGSVPFSLGESPFSGPGYPTGAKTSKSLQKQGSGQVRHKTGTRSLQTTPSTQWKTKKGVHVGVDRTGRIKEGPAELVGQHINAVTGKEKNTHNASGAKLKSDAFDTSGKGYASTFTHKYSADEAKASKSYARKQDDTPPMADQLFKDAFDGSGIDDDDAAHTLKATGVDPNTLRHSDEHGVNTRKINYDGQDSLDIPYSPSGATVDVANVLRKHWDMGPTRTPLGLATQKIAANMYNLPAWDDSMPGYVDTELNGKADTATHDPRVQNVIESLLDAIHDDTQKNLNDDDVDSMVLYRPQQVPDGLKDKAQDLKDRHTGNKKWADSTDVGNVTTNPLSWWLDDPESALDNMQPDDDGYFSIFSAQMPSSKIMSVHGRGLGDSDIGETVAQGIKGSARLHIANNRTSMRKHILDQAGASAADGSGGAGVAVKSGAMGEGGFKHINLDGDHETASGPSTSSPQRIPGSHGGGGGDGGGSSTPPRIPGAS